METPIFERADTKRGQPLKSLNDRCTRSKLCKISELRKSSGSELEYAASVNLRLESDAAAANLIREVAIHSPKNVNGIQKKPRT